MILRSLASIGVAAGLAGMLWSGAPGSGVVLSAVGLAEPADEMPLDGVPDELLEAQVAEYVQQMERQIDELRSAGLDDEANALQREAEQRVEAARELRERIDEMRREIAELHDLGRHEEADRLEHEAIDHLEQLKREGRPEHVVVIEAEELRERINDLRREVAELHEAGRHEEAERLKREARQEFRREIQARTRQAREERGPVEGMRDRAGPWPRDIDRRAPGRRDGSDRFEREAGPRRGDMRRSRVPGPRGGPEAEAFGQRLRDMKQKIEQLREHGRHEEADRLEKKVRDMAAMHRDRPDRLGPPTDRPDDIRQRILHIMTAVDNLRAAGIQGPAKELARHAEEMERALRTRLHGDAPRRRGDAPPQAKRMDELAEVVHRLRGEVQQLRHEVRQLRERVEQLSAVR